MIIVIRDDSKYFLGMITISLLVLNSMICISESKIKLKKLPFIKSGLLTKLFSAVKYAL